MSKKKIEPTDAMVASAHSAAVGRLMTDPMTYRRILRTALNHPDAAGLFECDHTDYVHVDEAATRVEAAHELGWDNAAEWMKDELPGIQWAADALNAANPYRPAPDLPTEDGAVIVPADGREFIEASALHVTGAQYCREAVYEDPYYYGVWWRDGKAVHNGWRAENITPGTWKVDDQ